MTARIRRILLVVAAVSVWSPAGADEAPGPFVEEPVPLPDDELRQITVSLLQRHPELAGSPGAKVAVSYVGGSGTIVPATVIYYPHAEHRGVKEAFQVKCRRMVSSATWTCDEVELRRYLQLASQYFEVRILGEVSSQNALALIEASRRDLYAHVTHASRIPTTAVLITPHLGVDGEYFVTWGTSEGVSQLTMRARLAQGADPANADNWRAVIFEPPAAR